MNTPAVEATNEILLLVHNEFITLKRDVDPRPALSLGARIAATIEKHCGAPQLTACDCGHGPEQHGCRLCECQHEGAQP